MSVATGPAAYMYAHAGPAAEQAGPSRANSLPEQILCRDCAAQRQNAKQVLPLRCLLDYSTDWHGQRGLFWAFLVLTTAVARHSVRTVPFYTTEPAMGEPSLCLFTATVPCRLAALARCRGQLGVRDSVSRRPWCPCCRDAQPLSPLTSSFPPLLPLSCGWGRFEECAHTMLAFAQQQGQPRLCCTA